MPDNDVSIVLNFAKQNTGYLKKDIGGFAVLVVPLVSIVVLALFRKKNTDESVDTLLTHKCIELLEKKNVDCAFLYMAETD